MKVYFNVNFSQDEMQQVLNALYNREKEKQSIYWKLQEDNKELTTIKRYEKELKDTQAAIEALINACSGYRD